jgi:hypothetical protein
MKFKTRFFIFILLSSFNLQAQQNFFRSNNSYAAPKEPINEIGLTVVGGGGGGGGDVGGGGGGGQVVNVSNYNITGVKSLSITVAGQTDYPAAYNHFGRNGGNSSVSGGNAGTITAMGGNGGRSRSSGGPGTNTGWNGGGGSYDYNTGNAGQGGFAGGNAFSFRSCGGGGGSGGAGQAATSTNPGNGGLGVLSIVDGKYYGGGGGGGEYGGTTTGLGTHGGGDGGRTGPVFGKDATPNTGGGGGGGPSTATNFNAGRGASGVVLIRYLGAPKATGGEISQNNGYTIHTFKSSGVFVVN